jgi:hypothetical protein
MMVEQVHQYIARMEQYVPKHKKDVKSATMHFWQFL